MIHNPERGEVLLEIGGAQVVLCFHMDRLAAFSHALGYPSLTEIYRRIDGAEINCLRHLIDCFTIKGDPQLIKDMMETAFDMASVVAAGLKMLEPFTSERKPPAKKAESGTDQATSPSRSANG